MRIQVVTPAPRGSRSGNRVTANRWSKLLRKLGHQVAVTERYDGQVCDLLFAIHARKSAAAILDSRQNHPNRPIVLAMAGTDLYRDIRVSKSAQKAMEAADRLVLLQPEGIHELPRRLHSKCHVIYQSSDMPQRHAQLSSCFEVSVVGHLRPVKDPFRAAVAARHLPSASRIRVVHLGAALSTSMERRALAEMARNPRYRWLGAQPVWRARKFLGRSRIMVISSKLEGGANVVSDAIVAGVPILASRISGTIGQLGSKYSGYFPVGDTIALRDLMRRAEEEPTFYRRLQVEVEKRVSLFTPPRELKSLRKLLATLT